MRTPMWQAQDMLMLQPASILELLGRLALFSIVCAVLWWAKEVSLSWQKPLVAGSFPVASLPGSDPKTSWMEQAEQLLKYGFKQYHGPFQVMTGVGPKIVVANKYADEMRNHPNLSFSKATNADFIIHFFEVEKEGFNHSGMALDLTRKLSQSLMLVTPGLVNEATIALDEIFGTDDTRWKTVPFKSSIMDLVTKLTSRVFLGLPLCRNEQWLNTAKHFTELEQTALHVLRMKHPLLRPLYSLVLPEMRAVRRLIRETRAIINPEVARRKAAVDAALREGRKPGKALLSDCIGMMYEWSLTKKKDDTVDYTLAQLGLSMAAIHTTSEATSVAMLALLSHLEVVEPLRQEIVEVIGEFGWAKTSLYRLKAMDSFLRETQRWRPNMITTMGRGVVKDTVLHDGTVLPKDSYVQVAINNMDPTLYPDPEKFDFARSLRRREQDGENTVQFIVTSPDHLCFGHGQFACPGRFFASNVIKIALCHLILRYDWRFVPGDNTAPFVWYSFFRAASPALQIQVRRRREEINLDFAS